MVAQRDLSPAGPVPSWGSVSQTGYWIMGVLGGDAFDALLADVDASAFESLPGDLDLGWWQAVDDLDVVKPAHFGHGTACPTDPAVLFQEELLGLRPDPDALDACIAAIGECAEADTFVVAVRKGDPVAAVFYGLGSAVARRLPGRAGCFLLHPGAQADLAALAGLLEASAHERARFADRVSRWLEAMADQSDLDPLRLLDGPRRLVRRAADTNRGLLAVMQWY
jgi:hypothetical protein